MERRPCHGEYTTLSETTVGGKVVILGATPRIPGVDGNVLSLGGGGAEWTLRPEWKMPRQMFEDLNMAELENLEGKNGILVSGGWIGRDHEDGTNNFTTRVDLYNVDTMEWEDWYPLPEGRGGHGMGYVGGKPAVMGGVEEWENYRTDIAVYRGGRWEQIQNTLKDPIEKSLYTSTVATNFFSCDQKKK